MLDLAGKQALVIGLARSGLAAAAALARHGAKVTLNDARDALALGDIVVRAQQAGHALSLGGHPLELLAGKDLIVLSPGVPSSLDLVAKAKQRGMLVLSEIELAFRLSSERPWVAVTGTNGKTTITSLLYAMFMRCGVPAILGGNIGQALADRVEGAPAGAAVVAEVSSFQLEDVDQFKPRVAVWSNLTPDHMDRYADLKAYGAAKARIFARQTALDVLVYNADDQASVECCQSAKATLWPFSRSRELKQGAFVRDGVLVGRWPDGHERNLLKVSELSLRGPHNLENSLAAAAAALAFGLDAEGVAEILGHFPGVEHRLEPCGEVEGIGFVNDSKATNVDSVEKALLSFEQPVHLILGGKDKEGDFTALTKLVRERVARMYLIGSAAEKIESQLGTVAPFERSGDLVSAMRSAMNHARQGQWILLSPGCASFDQFDNYEHRGRVFKECAQTLIQQRRPA